MESDLPFVELLAACTSAACTSSFAVTFILIYCPTNELSQYRATHMAEAENCKQVKQNRKLWNEDGRLQTKENQEDYQIASASVIWGPARRESKWVIPSKDCIGEPPTSLLNLPLKTFLKKGSTR